MRLSGWTAALWAAGLGLGAAAQAHEFTCEKTVDGVQVREILQYPATLHWEFQVTNTHPTDTSDALSAEDPLLAAYGYTFSPAAPFSLPVGASVSDGFSLTLHDEAECLALAAADGTPDRNIDNTFVVTWDLGGTVCSARAVCGAAEQTPAPAECTPGRGATRGLGFWKTHVDAAEACLQAGPIDLGITTLTTLADVEGVLWGSPAKFGDGQKRGDLDQTRFLLARELLVATCNVRVLGAEPASPTLFDEARAVLSGTDCVAISSFVVKLNRFQACGGDNVNTGQMFDAADPRRAQSLADDPTSPSGQTCGGRGAGGNASGGKR